MSTIERSRPLAPYQGAEPASVTYAEVRAWSVILQVFTISDLAYSMAISEEIAERGIRALLYHGIVESTGDWIDSQEILRYVPLPPGPNEHETGTPPWMLWPCGSEILSPRGLRVRIRTQRDQRGTMSTPGARRRLRDNERAYQRQEEAKARRAEEQRRKAETDPKWKRVRRGKRDRTYTTEDM